MAFVQLLTVYVGFALFGYVSPTDLSVDVHDLSLLVGSEQLFYLQVRDKIDKPFTITWTSTHKDLVKVYPPTKEITVVGYHNFTLHILDAGHDTVTVNTTDPSVNTDQVFIRLNLLHDRALDTASIVVGWIYFVAWSVSFYPQIYENWKRKSVIGLNFDFLALNLLGFFLYALFNCGLYWIPEVEQQYFDAHPRGLNPVKVNDIVFALHAFFATFLTIIQCFFYERGNQRVSWTARILLGVFGLFLLISLIISASRQDLLNWLMYLNFCSYVKLAITLIKYVPQAYMNFKRKSTLGWSIGNIILDCTGGLLSMLQMIFDSHNYNDWQSIFGDPTKFGLGLISVLFDVVFIIQHYILYRVPEYAEVVGADYPNFEQDTNNDDGDDEDGDP